MFLWMSAEYTPDARTMPPVGHDIMSSRSRAISASVWRAVPCLFVDCGIKMCRFYVQASRTRSLLTSLQSKQSSIQTKMLLALNFTSAWQTRRTPHTVRTCLLSEVLAFGLVN